MGLYLLPALSYYLLLFFENAFSPIVVIPILIALILLSLKIRKLALFALLSVLVFSITYKALLSSEFSSSLPSDKTIAIYGYVYSQPGSLENRDSSFRLRAIASVDQNGSVFSSKGIIYVFSDLMDANRGDYVRIDGKITNSGYFSSKSMTLIKKAPFGRLRELLIAYLREHFRFPGGNLSLMLLLGSDENGSVEIIDLSRKSGLSFLLSLSGMHLAIISTLIESPLSMLLGKKDGKWLSFIFMSIFTYASGWKPSLFRALLFRLLLCICDIKQAFVLSYFFLLMLLPGSASDLGAAFSFISLAGILMLSEDIARTFAFLFPLPRAFFSTLAASISALLFSTPIALETFGQYQLTSILWAIPASLLISTYMMLSILSLIIPQLSVLLSLLYTVVVALLSYVSSFECQYDYRAYTYLAASVSVVITTKYFYILTKKTCIRAK